MDHGDTYSMCGDVDEHAAVKVGQRDVEVMICDDVDVESIRWGFMSLTIAFYVENLCRNLFLNVIFKNFTRTLILSMKRLGDVTKSILNRSDRVL